MQPSTSLKEGTFEPFATPPHEVGLNVDYGQSTSELKCVLENRSQRGSGGRRGNGEERSLNFDILWKAVFEKKEEKKNTKRIKR